MLRSVSDKDVDEIANGLGMPDKFPVLELPCHSQALERHIKLVSEVSRKVVGEHARDGMIRTTLRSRGRMPAYKAQQPPRVF